MCVILVACVIILYVFMYHDVYVCIYIIYIYMHVCVHAYLFEFAYE